MSISISLIEAVRTNDWPQWRDEQKVAFKKASNFNFFFNSHQVVLYIVYAVDYNSLSFHNYDRGGEINKMRSV